MISIPSMKSLWMTICNSVHIQARRIFLGQEGKSRTESKPSQMLRMTFISYQRGDQASFVSQEDLGPQMLSASFHICAEQQERCQEGPGSSLGGSRRHRLCVVLCHGLPAAPLRGIWASPLPNSLAVQLLVSNRYPQMLVPVQQNFLQLGLSQTGKKRDFI